MTKPRAFSRLAAYLFVSVLLALGIAALVFAGVRSVLTNRMYDRVMSEAYQQQRSDESLASLQQFVDEHHLRISQVSRLQEWERSHPYTITTVSTAYRLLYSTGMGTSDMLPLEEDGPVDLLIGSLPLRFLDGQAGVYFYHTDEARYEAMITAGTGIGAFALFVALLMIPINRKLRYIKRLRGDLKILEGGDLNYAITLQGRDELYDLARGVEEMRLSLIRQQREREAAQQANAELVTAVSHDLRTPLTSLMGYMDLMVDGKYQSEQERRHFLTSARAKAYQIKELSDKLFDYFYVFSREEDAELARQDADILLGQMLDEFMMALDSQGFRVESSLSELNGDMLANPSLMLRAFDNLQGNIRKYADPQTEVWVSCGRDGQQAVLRVENAIAADGLRQESTNIGLKTCDRVFQYHGGTFETHENGDRFSAVIRLPLIPRQTSGRRNTA